MEGKRLDAYEEGDGFELALPEEPELLGRGVYQPGAGGGRLGLR